MNDLEKLFEKISFEKLLIYTRVNNIESDRLGSLMVPGLQQKTMAFMQEMLNLVKVFLNGC